MLPAVLRRDPASRDDAPPTVKQHMAAIRMLFSWLTEKGVLAMNPAREVKTERFSRTEGKTPAFVPFNLTIRLYTPKSDALTGIWNPPPFAKPRALPTITTQ
jgi:hypothetical protein